jgi:hypothetical protein
MVLRACWCWQRALLGAAHPGVCHWRASWCRATWCTTTPSRCAPMWRRSWRATSSPSTCGQPRAAFEQAPWVRKALVRANFPTGGCAWSCRSTSPWRFWGQRGIRPWSTARARCLRRMWAMWSRTTCRACTGPKASRPRCWQMYQAMQPLFERSIWAWCGTGAHRTRQLARCAGHGCHAGAGPRHARKRWCARAALHAHA